MSAQIEDFIPLPGQAGCQFVFEEVSGVIGAQGNSHGWSDPIMIDMRNTAKFLSAGALALVVAAGLSSHGLVAQGPSQPSPSQPNPGAGNIVPQQPTFRVAVDLVTTDAIP